MRREVLFLLEVLLDEELDVALPDLDLEIDDGGGVGPLFGGVMNFAKSSYAVGADSVCPWEMTNETALLIDPVSAATNESNFQS